MKAVGLLVTIACLLPAVVAAQAGDEVRRSGTLVEIGPKHQTLVLEEAIAWTGPGSGFVRRTVTVGPDTSVKLVTRTGDRRRTALSGWASSPLRFDDLRRGDFVTVTTRRGDTGPVAVAIEVIRPRGR